MLAFGKFKNGCRRIYLASKSDAVLVYQMGKVGSSSLGESIRDSANMHTLYGNPPCRILLDLERRGWWFFLGGVYDFVRRVSIRMRKDVKIITLVRSPVERNVSMFFQDFPYWYVDYRSKNRGVSRFSDETMVEDMYESVFPHDYVNSWFDKEIKRLTGIDVYAHPYDRSKGYHVYERGRFKLLLLEMTKVEDNWSVVQNFVGQNVELKTVNVGGNKWYGPIYKIYKPRLVANEKINNLVKSGKFYTKFYG